MKPLERPTESRNPFSTETPGHVCEQRSFDEIIKACSTRGLVILHAGPDGVVARHNKEHDVAFETYWNENGLVVRDDFIPAESFKRDDGNTNFYEFDGANRLVRFWQVVHPKGTRADEQAFLDRAQMMFDIHFEYISGRPDNEYTIRRQFVHANEPEETITFEDRALSFR